jgi:hypothetical protein
VHMMLRHKGCSVVLSTEAGSPCVVAFSVRGSRQSNTQGCVRADSMVLAGLI